MQEAAALEAELAEVRRRWADSRDAFAARAVADRDEIERLAHTVSEQEHALLQHFQVLCSGAQFTEPRWRAGSPSVALLSTGAAQTTCSASLPCPESRLAAC